MARGTIVAERAKNQADFEGQIARLNERYPEDGRVLITGYLHVFLETTTDVDWSAGLIDYGGEMVFANAAYLQKPWPWRGAMAATDALESERCLSSRFARMRRARCVRCPFRCTCQASAG